MPFPMYGSWLRGKDTHVEYTGRLSVARALLSAALCHIGQDVQVEKEAS